MATKTEIYELRKKEENDFYNIEDFNNNMDTLEKALTEFDDSGTAEGVTSFPEMLTKLVTGNKLAITLKNLKAGLQFVLHAGSIVNNCVTDNANLPVSAAMAKSLQDQINQANSNLDSGYFKIKVKTTTIVLIIEEFTFTNGVATKTLQSIFGSIPTYASGICQTKVEDSGVYNFTAVKDGNNLKIATAGSTFSGKKWVTMIIFGTA